MNKSEIKELTTKEVLDLIKEEELNYTKMKLAHAVSPLDNTYKLKEGRKTIARLKTELRARQNDIKTEVDGK